MKAVAVVPGRPDSVHLTDIREPELDDIPGGRGVKVKILRVDTEDRKIGLSRRLDTPIEEITAEQKAAAKPELKGGMGGESGPLFTMGGDKQ